MKTAPLIPAADAATDAIFAVCKLHGHLIALGDRMVKPFGLTSARWQILGSIALAETDVTVPQIARNLGLSRQAVQRVANDLEQAGLIAYGENPHHKRAKLVRLSPAGEDTYRKADRAYAAWANAAFSDLSASGIHKAIDTLTALDDPCSEYLNQPPPA
jgi:DNA-binding MarR family transcriptional regulator